jgi:O-antigen ligase
LTSRNCQRFEKDYLVDRWQEEEPDWELGSDIAKETALRALRRNPWQVLGLAAQTFAQYWNLRDLRYYATIDLGHNDLTEEQAGQLAEHFHFATDGRIIGAPPTLLQRYFLLAWPYCYFLLLSPLLGAFAVYRTRERQLALFLLLHLVIILSVTFTFAVAPSFRYLQPVSLLALLLVALCLRRPLSNRTPGEPA